MTLSQAMPPLDSAYPDALPGQYRLHWYVLERVLGQGGFGITYLAHDTNLDRRVAIKEYLPGDVAQRCPDTTVRPRNESLGERYAWGLERFIAEARTLARFDHPNIVRVHSVFEANDTAYMVMRFEEGDNLAVHLERRQTLAEEELLGILLPILDGLERVHEAGFIHRDIKPENIHLRSDGSPVLLDFGSARQGLGRSRTVTILVAPGYAPLEQYYGDAGEQGPWTDIYGLAATCYRAIAGRAPADAIVRTKGVLGSTREVLEPAGTVGQGRYSARLLAAIDHGLELGEKDRPQSLAAWRRELSDMAPQTAPIVTPLKPAMPSAATLPDNVGAGGPPTGQGPARTPGRTFQRWVRRARLVWAVGGAAAAAVGIAAFVSMQEREPDPKLAEQARHIEEQRVQWEAQSRELEARLRQEQQRREEEARMLAATQQTAPPPASPQPAREKPRPPDKPVAPAPKPPPKPGPKPEPAPAPVAPPPGAETVAKQEPAPKPAEMPARPSPEDTLAAAERAFAAGDYAGALRIAKPLAYAGQAGAQLVLGRLYEGGHGVIKSQNEAYMWYSLAAHRGNRVAEIMKERVAARLQSAELQQANRLVNAWEPRPGEGGEGR